MRAESAAEVSVQSAHNRDRVEWRKAEYLVKQASISTLVCTSDIITSQVKQHVRCEFLTPGEYLMKQASGKTPWSYW